MDEFSQTGRWVRGWSRATLVAVVCVGCSWQAGGPNVRSPVSGSVAGDATDVQDAGAVGPDRVDAESTAGTPETGGADPEARGRVTTGYGTPPDYLSQCDPPEVDPSVRRWLQNNDACTGDGRRYFDDVTLEAGAAHRHRTPAFAREFGGYGASVGGGAVLEDLNGDGWLDLYVAGGTGPNRLLYNEGDGTFVDCTEYAGVGLSSDWTNGVSAADYDNDGDQDLYIANAGPDRLLENEGDGTFRDVTEGSGLADPGRSSTASWGDLNGDGHLDLVVASLHESHAMPGREPPYYEGDDLTRETAPSSLYLGDGDGTFTEKSGRVPGTETVSDATFIVSVIDLNDDGRPELFWTREFEPTQLFEPTWDPREKRLRFRDFSARARGGDGVPTGEGLDAVSAPMGVAAFDLDADRRVELSVSSLWGQGASREYFLENRGELAFRDVAGELGAFAMIQEKETPFARGASFGNVGFDLENDGDEDLYIPYGRVFEGLADRRIPPVRRGQPNALLEHTDGAFETLAGSCAEDRGRSRGVVRGDVDGDGCVDLFIVNQGTSTRLLRNRCDDGNHFIEVRLVGTRGTRDAVNATVEIRADGERQTRQVLAGSTSVHSANPKRLHFGLGDAERVAEMTIHWPSGTTQTFEDLESDQLLTVREPE